MAGMTAESMLDATRTWSGTRWSVTISDTGTPGLVLETPAGAVGFGADEVAELAVRRGWIRWGLYRGAQRLAVLRGISSGEAHSMTLAVRKLALNRELARATTWADHVETVLAQHLGTLRWIPTETVDALMAERPAPGLGERVGAARCTDVLTESERRAVAVVETDLEAWVDSLNRRILDGELRERRGFFDSIERSPLTDEQATAVVCFDNRVQVLAAAGSGKTSVMVARAAYAVQRGFVAPDRIVLLAFNKAAADELRERVRDRFAAAGIDSSGARVATFHSFGLDVIGAADGRKPRVASWLADRDGVGEVLRTVDALSDASPGFRYDWDLYRLLFSAASTELGDGEPDGWDSATSTAGFRTFRGEVVKSHGERLIADFLFLSGVDYRYEHRYSVDVADATHSQYRPDFYYPDVDVWHEHWAIGPDGSPPADFAGYEESMAWKCDQHARHGTRLIETTFHEVVNGDGLSDLRAELEAHGVVFDWNPDRPLNQWVRPMDHTAMARLVRTFMAHVKSNSLTPAAMDERLRATPQSSGFRTELFLRIYWQIHHEWQRRLAADEAVDFEDMLNAATDRVEAGSDLSVMTRFHDWFGNGVQLALTTTFRCPQRICDVASRFVSANPAQLSKPMRSAGGSLGVPVRVLLDDDPRRAVAACLKRLSAAVSSGSVEPGRDGRVTVDVLGRYGFQRDLVGRAPANLDVRFRTVHSSKGLEADHVIVVGLDTSRHGFPSRIADDPVLDLAMPNSESFPHAEERRLFYVALTRARREVTVIAPSRQMSPFVVELLADPDVVTETTGGASTAPPTPCPRCRTGTMTARSGPHGPFLGCTNFPACRQTQPHA